MQSSTDVSATAALECKGVYGFNWRANGLVHALSSDHSPIQRVCYVAGHTAVIQSADNSQKLLRGHRHGITCSAVSSNRRWLVTADQGEDCAMIVWDTHSGLPVRTYFLDQLLSNVSCLDISDDAMYIVTGHVDDVSRVSVWDWTSETLDSAMYTVELPDSVATLVSIRFNRSNARSIIANSQTQVVFLDWEFQESLTYSLPNAGAVDIASLGQLSQSLFLPGNVKAGTTSDSGYVVVWRPGDNNTKGVRQAVKMAKLGSSPITVVTVTPNGKYLVAGAGDGSIRFYDAEFRMLAWHDKLNMGPIRSLSFAATSARLAPFTGETSVDILPCGERIEVPPLILATETASLLRIGMGSTPELSLILMGLRSAVNSISAHPSQPLLAVGAESGSLTIWNYDHNRAIVHRQLPSEYAINALAYSPDGHTIAVGACGGQLLLLDSLSLREVSTSSIFKISKGAITHVAWSRDGNLLAVADKDRCVSVYKAQERNLNEPWTFVGKHRSHTSFITDILFFEDAKNTRLFSLGSDRMLVEYDLAGSSFSVGLLLKGERARLEQGAQPQCMVATVSANGEPQLLTANDQFKLRFYNLSTKMCRKTVLGPTLGQSLSRMLMLKSNEGDNILSFTSGEKLGVALCPLDGNPNRHLAVVAHSNPITALVKSFDGKYVFTTAGNDASVSRWAFHPHVLQAAWKLGGDGVAPFIAQLDGGEDSECYAELEDYFYYMQIRQTEFTQNTAWKISEKISVKDIPDLMRAIGFFPSDQQAEEMMNEIKYQNFPKSSAIVETIDLETFITLYVNHRPVQGISPQKLSATFSALHPKGHVPALELLTLLKTGPEKMSEEDVSRYVSVLLGEDEENMSRELATQVDAHRFATRFLGFA